MTSIRNLLKSFSVAAAFAAIILAGLNPGIASAAPAQQIAANVVLTIPAGPNVGGNYDETPGQSWVWVYPVAKHGTYTGTVATAIAAHDIGQRGNAHEFLPIGNRQFRGSVDPGDYLVVAHLGTNTYVMNRIETIADGSQLPGQTHTMTWTGSGTTTGTNKGAGGTAAKTKPAAAPVLTPLCLAILPLAKTGGTTFVMSGGVFSGKVAFVLATNTSVLSVEAAEAMVKADGDNAVIVDFTGVPLGTPVEIPSGAYQVFTVEPNGRLTPLGFLNAPTVVKPATATKATDIIAWRVQVAHTALNRANATCPKYPTDMLLADPARTGGNGDWPGGLAGNVLPGLVGIMALAWALWPRRRPATNRVAC